MRRMIGFMSSNESKTETPSVPTTIRGITPVKSLVKVRFECHSMPLAYTRLTHIAEYVTADYIPCTITAGNTDCYPEDAKELHDRLTELDVEHSYYYVDADVAVLNHGYLSSFEISPHAKESLDQCMAFIQGQVGIFAVAPSTESVE